MHPLGYTVQGEVIDDEAATVRAIFATFARAENPESLCSLARALSGAPRFEVEGVARRSKHTHVVSVEREAICEGHLFNVNKLCAFDRTRIEADGPCPPLSVASSITSDIPG